MDVELGPRPSPRTSQPQTRGLLLRLQRLHRLCPTQQSYRHYRWSPVSTVLDCPLSGCPRLLPSTTPRPSHHPIIPSHPEPPFVGGSSRPSRRRQVSTCAPPALRPPPPRPASRSLVVGTRIAPFACRLSSTNGPLATGRPSATTALAQRRAADAPADSTWDPATRELGAARRCVAIGSAIGSSSKGSQQSRKDPRPRRQ